MQGLHDLPTLDERQLSAEVASVIAQMRQRIEQQAQQIDARQAELQAKAREIERKDREIAWRDAKLEKIHFELARLKRWKFGAKSEAMTAEQRALFEETVFEDEAANWPVSELPS